MTAFYNEHDPKAAAWLRELIRQGHIAPGVVDERSIEDVAPHELEGFTQCHFFAGIGVWSHALRQAGWPDERPVWTGSCPCQPFSAAGKGGGFADERHLWPAWHWLISQCKPDTVFGEQVASKDGLSWFDLVQTDMEGSGYAIGALDTCAAGFGAPHIRQRLYFGAHRLANAMPAGRPQRRPGAGDRQIAGCSAFDELADANNARSQGRGVLPECAGERLAGAGGVESGLADANGGNACAEGLQRGGEYRQRTQDSGAGQLADAAVIGRERRRASEARDEPGSIERPERFCDADRPGPVNGFWRNADWIGCTDGKWRPVEPGAFPLAHRSPARVGRLRGYGNAIVAPQATAFIKAFLEATDVFT